MSALQAIGILAIVALAVGVLWAIRPGAAVRATRRSIRLGFPLALSMALMRDAAFVVLSWVGVTVFIVCVLALVGGAMILSGYAEPAPLIGAL